MLVLPDAAFDIGSDRIRVIDDHGGRVMELRGDQQLFDKAYEGVLLEILHCDDRRCFLEIRPRGVDIQPLIGEAPGHDAQVLRTRKADCDIRLSFQQAEQRGGD